MTSLKLTPHFTLAEFVASQTAARRGIDNTLPDALLPAARETCEMLERIRAFLRSRAGREVPILVTSGYRSNLLNRAIGSGDSSDHVRAMAADFVAPAFGSALDVCRALAQQVDALGIGQLINEFPRADGGGWVHVSTRHPSKALNRVITITAAGAVVGVVPA